LFRRSFFVDGSGAMPYFTMQGTSKREIGIALAAARKKMWTKIN
jgi:hypothetical protein